MIYQLLLILALFGGPIEIPIHAEKVLIGTGTARMTSMRLYMWDVPQQEWLLKAEKDGVEGEDIEFAFAKYLTTGQPEGIVLSFYATAVGVGGESGPSPIFYGVLTGPIRLCSDFYSQSEGWCYL